MPALPSVAGKSASSRTMLADLPPSSRNTRFNVSAPRAAMCLPTAVEPVNEIMSTRWSPVSTSPTSAGIATTVTTLTHARRDVGLLGDQLADPRRRVGRVGRGLQHHGAAGRERGRELRQVQHEREVPRRDEPDHADRLRDDQPVRRHPEELVRPELVLPLVAVDEVDVPLHVVDAAVLLHRVRQADRRAHLGDDLRAQLFLVLVERLLELEETRPCATHGSSTSRSRRTPAARRRSHGPCRRPTRRRRDRSPPRSRG